MRILIYSPAFHPSIGGLEAVVSILAHEFVRQGHEIKLVTTTPANGTEPFPFEVIRRPGPRQLLRLTRWCEIFFQPNISLKGMWPLLLSPRRWVVSHNGEYRRTGGSLDWKGHLKHFMLRFATGISVSCAIADAIPTPSTIIPNPFSSEIFHSMPDIPRYKELVFLGRLVSDKGVDVLLAALSKLKERGQTPHLTIIGGGPEETNLRQQVENLRLKKQVEFAGVQTGETLARMLHEHHILVVPSRWAEPFGVVALEGIACGCVVVGSSDGGLKEALGPCGMTFPNGDVEALALSLADLLTNPEKLNTYRANSEAHLARHQKAAVAKAYLEVFEEPSKALRLHP